MITCYSIRIQNFHPLFANSWNMFLSCFFWNVIKSLKSVYFINIYFLKNSFSKFECHFELFIFISVWAKANRPGKCLLLIIWLFYRQVFLIFYVPLTFIVKDSKWNLSDIIGMTQYPIPILNKSRENICEGLLWIFI